MIILQNMTKKTRLIILLVCIFFFLAGVSIIIPYSMGYRFDIKKMKITETGGIYVRSFPAADQIIIDSKSPEKPGLFSNYIFVQNLIPNVHSVLVKKEGYYDYTKNLPVQEKEVTKIENIILFKKNINFEVLPDESQSPFNTTDKYIIKNNNLYYSDSKENSGLSALQISTPILKKIISFKLQNGNIIWLGTDGFLYKSNLGDISATPEKITLDALKISKTASYKIITDNRNIFIIADNELFYLDTTKQELQLLDSSIQNAVISPDGKNLVYHNNNNIYILSIVNLNLEKNIIYQSKNKIADIFWINNDYIIFISGNEIKISEIDYRDNINTITLPQEITITPEKEFQIKSPTIFFDRQTGKLFLLLNSAILSSERIIP